MINIAVQAFFFAKDKEAVELAITQNQSATQASQSMMSSRSYMRRATITVDSSRSRLLQKILSLCTHLRRSDKQYNAFKRMASKVIRSPNDTRWNSYLNTFEDAIQLKTQYTSFCADNDKDECHLTASEWQLVQHTVDFLQPFKDATKRCEGD